MSFLGSIFGSSSYNAPGWMRDAGRSIFDQYGDMADDYNPQAVVGQGMEDYDSMLRNSMAARGNQLSGDGYRMDSNPTGDIQRARYGASLWTKARQDALDWRRKLLAERFGMLNGMQDLFGRTYKPGFASVFGKGLGEAVTSIGSGGTTDQHSAGMGGGSTSNQSVYGPMTPTQGETGYNYDEGTNDSMGANPFKSSFGSAPGLSYQQPSWARRKRNGSNW